MEDLCLSTEPAQNTLFPNSPLCPFDSVSCLCLDMPPTINFTDISCQQHCLSLSLSLANVPAALSALYSRAPSSREEMPSPEEVYFKDSPAPFVLSLLSISRRDGFIAHPIDWASLSPARPFSQRVKQWFVNGGKHSGPCVECSGPLLFLCTHTHTPTIHHQD